MLEIYSPSGAEGAVANYLVNYMQQAGFRKAYVDEAGNAVGEIGASAEQAEKTIVLLGHIDTVEGFIPVRIEPDGDTIYGRGAADAKGPFASFVLGAAALAETSEVLIKKRIVVVGAVEEEAASSKGARYAQHQYKPDFCIIGEPSSWSHVTLGYKGRLLIDYSLSRDTKHTAADGPSACEEGVDFWNAIKNYANDFNKTSTGENKKIFETLQTSLRHINSEANGFQETVQLRVGLRIPLNFPMDEFKTHLEEWKGEANLELSGEELAVRSDKNNALVRAFLAGIRAEGGQPGFKVKTGTSDMNVLGPVWGCPIVAYGPGDSSLDHTPHEHASLQELERGVRVISRVLAEL
jgi:LysW-gamma-L-lysine carboxypeptidase